MTFSIVIPTYNGEIFLANAIESALSQTRPADEIIVADDNSSDSTIDIASRYADRVRVCRHEGPSGFVNGWNKAIAYAKCDFIAILHQDDLLHPDFLKEAERVLTSHPDVRHFFAICDYVDGDGKVIGASVPADGSVRRFTGREYTHAYMSHGNPHVHRCPGVITHRDLFSKCTYRTEAGHMADDDFFYRIGNHTDIVGVFSHLASYRLHDKSETGHLSELRLNKRLWHDYTFQCHHIQDNPLLGDYEKTYFRQWQYLHWRRALGTMLKTKQFSDVFHALLHAPLASMFRYTILRQRVSRVES